MSELDVIIDHIRDHAGHLTDDIIPDLDIASEAADSVSASENEDAYGVLCAPFLVPGLSLIEGGASLAMSGCRSAVERFAGASLLLAAALDLVDGDNADDIGDAGSDIINPLPGADPIPMPEVDTPGTPVPMPHVQDNPPNEPVAV